MTEPTLYERLGGVYAISAVVDYFLRTLWLCAIAGGPFQYTGRPLGDAHFDFQFTPTEFDEVSAVLAEALDHFKVPRSEKEEVLAAFEAYKPAVTAGSILR